jgi:hypothetical protein
MATVAQASSQAGYIEYVVGVASSFTTYATSNTAIAAAITASAGASSAPYYVALVIEQVTAPGRVDLVPGNPGPQTWIIQAVSATQYYPLSTATTQGYTTSAANSNAGVYVAECRYAVTGP